jgi:hypothetical protein
MGDGAFHACDICRKYTNYKQITCVHHIQIAAPCAWVIERRRLYDNM